MEEGTESEQISDNFTCAVCLDVLYKPIVLVCGHVSCFWCCQHSMHMRGESHCPLCRHPYHHFPAICKQLHFLLKKLYPISYKRRTEEILEHEKHSTLGFSPDIDNLAGPSSIKKIKLGEFCDGICEQVSVGDVLCGSCKQLLFRPVVLNCGHVLCEACVCIPNDGMIKCEVCECRHPTGIPKICREFDQFLEERFCLEYELRRNTIKLNQEPTQNMKSTNEVPKLPFPTEDNFLEWWSAHGSKFHDNVGCDMCGMCPIIGDRYKCKDCPEKCGYDLCGDCHKSGSNIPGRFNQKHTQTHQLELVKPVMNRHVIYRLLSGQLASVSAIASRSRSTPVNVSPNLASDEIDEEDSVSTQDQSDD